MRFTLEAGEAIGIACEGFRQDLRRNVTIQLRVARAIDLAHPSVDRLAWPVIVRRAVLDRRSLGYSAG